MEKKFDPTQLDETTEKFLAGGIKMAAEGEKADEVNWAQDPEEVLLKQQMDENEKLHDVDTPKVS